MTAPNATRFRSPCTHCPLKVRCGTQLLACYRLVAYRTRGAWSPAIPARPSAELFKQADSLMFGEARKP